MNRHQLTYRYAASNEPFLTPVKFEPDVCRFACKDKRRILYRIVFDIELICVPLACTMPKLVLKMSFLWRKFHSNWGRGFESQTFLVFFKPFWSFKTLKKSFCNLILTKTILWNHQITKMKNILWYPRPHCASQGGGGQLYTANFLEFYFNAFMG